jgi:hypothetical protein
MDKGRAYDINNNTDVKLKAFLDAMTKKNIRYLHINCDRTTHKSAFYNSFSKC